MYKPVDYKWHILGYDIPWWGGKKIYILPAVGLSILTYGIIWGQKMIIIEYILIGLVCFTLGTKIGKEVQNPINGVTKKLLGGIQVSVNCLMMVI